ncbi:hypothetical protein C7271_02615 [filamentous cyanobacterium CCP5]|nr:hypothetical protein C7271_02615 [filamentous cyanobacterium CCP5]
MGALPGGTALGEEIQFMGIVEAIPETVAKPEFEDTDAALWKNSGWHSKFDLKRMISNTFSIPMAAYLQAGYRACETD